MEIGTFAKSKKDVMLKQIPNLLTMCNLFCGCCAIIFILNGQQNTATWFTVACFVFDYLDGMVARALKISSPLGKELDSLADVISFGVVPSTMLYVMLSHAAGNESDTWLLSNEVELLALPAFILAAFSGLRLGKFNIDTRQTNYFIGLSTPACTIFMMGLTLTAYYDTFGLRTTIQQIGVIYPLIALFSFLLICEIPMFGMKIKSFDLKSNAVLLVFLGLFVAACFFLKTLALSLIIVTYIVVSFFSKNKITG
jgi:CDP-diacylglycerol---serine O-phosphatidyltransferase